MRIMTFPARKAILLMLEMDTRLIFSFNLLKLILFESLVTAMAVDAVKLRLHPQITAMRKFKIAFRMTIGAAEAFMV